MERELTPDEQYLDKLIFIDPWVDTLGYGGLHQLRHFEEYNAVTVARFFEQSESEAEAMRFILWTNRDRSGEAEGDRATEARQRAWRLEFWVKWATTHLSPEAMRVLRQLLKARGISLPQLRFRPR